MDTLTSNPADCSVPSPVEDTGLLCLLMLARFHDLPVDGGQIQHQFGHSGKVLATQDLLRAAKHVGFRVGLVTARWDELTATPLPAIVQLLDGRYVVLAKAQDDKVLIHDPLGARPLVQSRVKFRLQIGTFVVVFQYSKRISKDQFCFCQHNQSDFYRVFRFQIELN